MARPSPLIGFLTGKFGSLTPSILAAPVTAVQWALNVWSTNGPLSIPSKTYKKVSKLVVWGLHMYRWVVSICLLVGKMVMFEVPHGKILPVAVCCIQLPICVEESDNNHDCSWANRTPPRICDVLDGLKQSFLYQFFNLVCAALTRRYMTLVAVIVCSISLKNASHNDCMTGMICKGGTAHGLLCQVTYWITFRLKFQGHNVMSVPSRSWLFLMLPPGHDSAEPWVDEVPTISTFEGAQEGVRDVKQDLWRLGGRGGAREAPWTVWEVGIPAGL